MKIFATEAIFDQQNLANSAKLKLPKINKLIYSESFCYY